MGLVDFIINAAALLLWFNWRRAWVLPPAAATHRRANDSSFARRISLAALLALVLGRAVFYRLLGPPADWTASLDLGAITLFFRSDRFWLMLLFSLLSFGRALVVVYFWALTLVIVNKSTSPDSIGAVLRRQLGSVGTYPTAVQLALPFVLLAATWHGLQPLLAYSGVAQPVSSYGRLLLQGLLVGLGPLFSLKYLIPPLLCADFASRYIYFGNNPIWDFLNNTACNLLAPLNRLPLKAGKVDFVPVAGILLAVLVLHTLPLLLIAELNRRHLTIWPQ